MANSCEPLDMTDSVESSELHANVFIEIVSEFMELSIFVSIENLEIHHVRPRFDSVRFGGFGVPLVN
jgi:hypothetical protein